MRLNLLAPLLVSGLCFAASAFAQTADDKKWIRQCLADNQEAKVAAAVVSSYCTCMNNKMSDNETRSITQWEKTNPGARKACEQESGWN